MMEENKDDLEYFLRYHYRQINEIYSFNRVGQIHADLPKNVDAPPPIIMTAESPVITGIGYIGDCLKIYN